MLDIKVIREEPERVKKDLRKRGEEDKLGWVDDLRKRDKKWRSLKQETDQLKHERNVLTRKVGEKKEKGEIAEEEIKKSRELSEQIKSKENEMSELKVGINSKLTKLPNLLHPTVPKGEDEGDNVEVRRWGDPPEFSFEPKTHLEILESLDMFDRERGAKTSASDFYFLKGDLVKLDMALKQFALDYLAEKGYELVHPPYVVNKDVYEGMIGSLENLGEASYKIEDKELWLIPTAEYPIGGMYTGETFLEENLPKRVCGISACFRREVGTHGKYSKGLYRVHQFNKVEQFIFSKPENSWKLFEELQENAEKLYQKLGLHYRVVNVCTGDLGPKASKKYDIECWMSDGEFHETGSNSNCLDYQARNLNIKYRKEAGKKPEGYVHTLNNTALAMSRTIVSIVEQYQQENGTVKIPEPLQKYMDGRKVLGPEG